MKKISSSNFGYCSILLAFIMICIMTFSALSLITANSDYRLSKKVAEKNSNYYAAESNAYQTLSKIDTALSQAYQNSVDEHTYFATAETLITSIPSVKWEQTENHFQLSYSESISDTQELQITLQLQYPFGDSHCFYTILQWQSVSQSITPEEEPLNLIGSNE